MIRRCYAEDGSNYQFYGGKGVGVCEEWRTSYTTFRDWARSSGYSDELELDRIDPEKNYGPDNCRWLSSRENVKRSRLYFSPETDAALQRYAQELGVGITVAIVGIVTSYLEQRPTTR